MQHSQIIALYEAHGFHIHQKCKRILHDEEEAYDTCQEAFLRLVESKKPLSQQDALPWLYRVATNLCIDKLRKHKHVKVPLRLDELTGTHSDEVRYIHRDQVQKLWRVLDAEERMLLLLRHVDELSLEEMEEVCGNTRKTISKKLARLQKKARNVLLYSGGKG